MKKLYSAILVKKSVFIILIIYILSTHHITYSQSRVWIFFKDKQGSEFDPYSYFDRKAIERREKLNLTLYDITDFPLSRDYINIIRQNTDTLYSESRWFNAVAVYAEEQQIESIKQMDFVEKVEPITMFVQTASRGESFNKRLDSSSIELLMKQTERMGGKYFTEKGIDGRGLRIAIFDGGFPNVDKSPVFEHIRKEGRIIKTWDFTRGKEFVYSYNTHGTMVMSCIGGIVNGIKIGLATGAEYMLARTEVNAEKYSEEENWLAAVEWADRNGADIINSSLGYTYHRYYPEQMDGRTTLATRAAELAAKKGILVVNAAGNDGMTRWQGIGAPADADSILSVGGIDPKTDYHINFSSYGPTADKRLKPNVCSYGQVMACGRRGMQKVEGTSFASPLVAGFAACAWQKKREMTNTELLHEIEKSADMYPYFDYAHGYGVPQADYFVNNGNIDAPSATFDFIKEDLTLKVVIKDEFIKESGNNILYYNIEDGKGVLKKYYVVSVTEKEPVTLKISDFKKGEKINVLYKHYTSSCEL